MTPNKLPQALKKMRESDDVRFRRTAGLSYGAGYADGFNEAATAVLERAEKLVEVIESHLRGTPTDESGELCPINQPSEVRLKKALETWKRDMS
jgi:hypothetical protein